MRIILQKEAINVGAGIAFVCVRDDEFVGRILPGDGAPFGASWKACTAAAAQAGSVDFIENLPWLPEEGGLERAITPARQVLREASSATLH
jgi:hypothetical protein